MLLKVVAGALAGAGGAYFIYNGIVPPAGQIIAAGCIVVAAYLFGIDSISNEPENP